MPFGLTTALYHHVAVHEGSWLPVDESTGFPELESGEIHLVALDLDGVSASRMNRVLNDADRTRGARILDSEKRRLYLGGRFGLKLLLQRYTGVDPDDQRFVYGSRGKPSLADQSIFFNYTLSRDKVLYALSCEREVGVDMEVLPRRVSAAHMAATRLTDAERRAWASLPESQRNDGMLCCWTRKEAYGKTIGVGIRFRLGEVNLFHDLSQARWQTTLSGLFAATDPTGMPILMEGAQMALPFAAVASVMYGCDDSLGQNQSPTFKNFQITVQ